MAKISGKALREIFEESIKDSGTYKRLDDGQKNPAHIIFNGIECYVYIKNLSYAYLGNPDVWRAQMTNVDVLNEIKESPAMFVLLGYDSDNNVYATWNPHQVKQRIGTASSPSLYSRLSLQQEVGRTGEIKSMVLNNDLEVLVFPNARLIDVMSNLDQFFPDTTDYVALGSKRRSEANAAYKKLTNTKKLDEYAKFLLKTGVLPSEVERQCQSLKRLFNSNLISLHRKIFLAHDSLEDYQDAAEEFFNLDDVFEFVEKWGNIFPSVFLSYIDFLQHSQISEPEEPKEDDVFEESSEEQDSFSKDWENSYEDEQGNLTKLMNPELLKLLRPYLDTDYPSLPPCYNIIGDFYGNRYPKMQLKDWGRLLKDIEWNKCNEDGIVLEDNKTRKKKTYIIRVEFPDGRIIEDKNVSLTYCSFIKEIGAEEISILGISHAGVNIVSRKLDSKYSNYQRDIGNGWYVMTNSSTHRKYKDLQRIIDEYGLDIKISLVHLDPSIPEYPIVSINTASKRKNSERDKIKVRFPDGRVIQPNKVFESLIEVVKYAGAERVHSLNILCRGNNLILKDPSPIYMNACKPVGNGWLCNTYTDTRSKYNQIKYISEQLKLGIEVELIQLGFNAKESSDL